MKDLPDTFYLDTLEMEKDMIPVLAKILRSHDIDTHQDISEASTVNYLDLTFRSPTGRYLQHDTTKELMSYKTEHINKKLPIIPIVDFLEGYVHYREKFWCREDEVPALDALYARLA